jgi:hypothetical protein
MKIKYKDKNIALPFNFGGESKSTSTEMVSRTNTLSGQSIDLPAFAAAVYDHTISSNHKAEEEDAGKYWGYSQHWDSVRKGIDWFRRYFAKEYMVLLD